MTQTIQALTTQTAAFTGAAASVDNTLFQQNGLWSLQLCVSALSAGAEVLFEFQFSTSYPAFQSFTVFKSFSFAGIINQELNVSVTQKDFPTISIGNPNAAVRLVVASLTGPNPSVTYRAWFTGATLI